ncbi:MAG: response regulator [Leptolyngbyaceae cyanobacterium MO_188.B28]|nr:response regulator [Leptolyngbyaceae cyanobacterium MO_188.B28]
MQQILIVEDEPRVAALMEKGLAKHGFATAVARDSDEAIQRAQQDTFDLMLLDIGLPGKDGWTVVRELHNQGKQLPIIVVSARSDIPETINRENYEVDDYITKPFRVGQLIDRIQKKFGGLRRIE